MRGSNDPFFPEGLPGTTSDLSGQPNPLGGDALRLPTAKRRPPAMAPVPDLMALVRALRSRWAMAAFMGTLAAVAAGGMAWRFVPRPKFTAASVIEVKAERPNLLPGSSQAHTDLKIFQSTQLSLVRSRLVMNAALKRPEIARLPTVVDQIDPVEWLSDALIAEFPTSAELMRISLSGDRPGDITSLVNGVSEAYLEEVVTKDHTDRLGTLSQLKTLLDQYNAKLTEQRTKLREMAQSVGSDDRQTLALKQQMAVQQLGEEKRELLQVQTELKRDRAELKVLHEAAARDGRAGVDRRAVEDALDREPALERFREQSAELAMKLDRALRLVRNEADPSVREARRSLDRVRKNEATARATLRPKIEREIRAIDESRESRRAPELETRLRILTEYEKVLNQGIAQLETEGQTFNRQTIDLQWKKDEISQGEEIARQLGRQIESLNVDLKAPQRGRLIEPADGARVESRRKWLMAIVLSSAAAFGLAIFGVAWCEFRLRRVGSADEVSQSLGLRLVGTLPALPMLGRGRSKGDGDSSAGWQDMLVESIDAARTVILRDCRADSLRTIMITSATKGEGKSSLSGHLAISLARTGRRTLLVDFDLRSPTVHKLFDLPQGPGVSEVLRGEIELDAVVNAVGEDLDVLTAGRSDARAIRALGQAALPVLLAQLAGRYDLVVIDTAPVLPVADSILISQHVDAVLLSVYREVSRVPAVYTCYDRLASLGVRVLGAVVTGVPASRFSVEQRYAAARGA